MLYEALLELLRLYPKFVGTPTAAAGGSATPTSRRLFLTGESHAGHYIPSFGAYLLKRNEAPDASIKINLAGIAIGNGWTDPSNQYDVSDFVYGMGIISSAQREELKAREKVCHSSLSRGILASKACFSLLDDALDASGYGKLSRASMYDIRLFEHTSSYPPGHDAVERYLNRADVRKALHVGPLTGRYVECADPPYNALSHQDGLGAVGELVQLLHAQIPVLLFSGQFDVICNHIGTQRMLDKMEWNGNAGWRAAKSAVWSADGKDPSGYIKSYQNLNFLSVLDSGHMVPLSKPKESLDMIRRFVQGKPFADIPSKVGSKVPIQSTGIGSVPSVTFNCSDIAEIMGSSKVQNVIAPAAIAAPKLSLPPIPLDASVALYLDSSEALSGGGAVRVKISPSGSLFEKNASSILIRGLENGKSVGIELQYILAGKLTSSTTYAMVTPGCYNPGKVQCCGAGTCVYDTKNTRGQCMCDAGRFGANCEERGSAGGPNHCPNVPQYPLLDRSKAADVSTAAKSNCGSGNCAVRIRLSLLISVDSRMNIFNDQGAIDSFELLLETELVSILKCEVAECIFALKIEQGQAIMTSEAFNAELIVFSHSGAVVDNIVAQLISQLRSNNSPLRFGLLTRYITQDYNIFLDQSLAETGIKPVFRKKETSTIIIDSNRDSYLKWGQALLIVVIAVTVMEAGRRVYSRFLPERRPVTRISLVPI
jgi:pimeloyl-ACP methyl ester carboxylesterase